MVKSSSGILNWPKAGAYVIKHKVVNNLEKYLIEFAANFEKKGGKIIWAQDKDEAVREIMDLIKKNNVSLLSNPNQ